MIALLLAAVAAAAPAEKLYVFRFVGEDVDPKVLGVLERAVVEEAEVAGFDAVSHDEIGVMLDVEAAKQLAGCDASASCVAEIAGSLGVSRVISARVTALGDTTVLALTLTDAKNARVVARETVEGRDTAALRAATPGAVRRLLGIAADDAADDVQILAVTGGVTAAIGVGAVVVGGFPLAAALSASGDAEDAAALGDVAVAGRAHDDYEVARDHWNSWGVIVACAGAAAVVVGAGLVVADVFVE